MWLYTHHHHETWADVYIYSHAPSSRHFRALLSVCGRCSFGGLRWCSYRVRVCRGCCSLSVCVCVCDLLIFLDMHITTYSVSWFAPRLPERQGLGDRRFRVQKNLKKCVYIYSINICTHNAYAYIGLTRQIHIYYISCGLVCSFFRQDLKIRRCPLPPIMYCLVNVIDTINI